MIYYSFLFVDGIQGIAVSYVFCYRTPEGKEIISKWWLTFKENVTSPNGWLSCFGCCKRKARQGREQALLGSNKKFNQSTRSNNSASCNGGGDMVTTELISVKDSTPTANKNF